MLIEYLRRLLLPILSLMALVPLSAAAAEPELSADQPIAFDTERKVLVASGNAVFRDDQTLVQADEIRFYRETGWIEALGNVIVMREGIRLLTDSLRYHTETEAIHCGRFRAGYSPLFLEGDSFSGTLDEIRFDKVTVFFREPQPDSPRIRFHSGTWIPDESLSGEDPHLHVLGPLGLPLPDFDHSFGSAVADADGSLGYRQNLGAYGRLSLRVPVRPGLAAGGHFHLYSRRGLLLGPSLSWQRSGAGKAHATFRLDGGWIRDQGSADQRGEDRLQQTVPPDRGFLDTGFYARNGTASWQARGQVQLQSDTEVLRDFLPDQYLRDFEPDSFAELVYQRDAFLLQLLTRAQLNEDSTLIERLPQISMEWLPGNIGDTRWIGEAGMDFLHYRLQAAAFPDATLSFPANSLGLPDSEPPLQPFPVPGLDLVDSPLHRRLSANFTLTRPIALPAGLQLNLRAGALARYYHRDSSRGEEGFSDSLLTGELGFDLRHAVARTWKLQPRNERGLRALRHISRLSWSHRWHPSRDVRPFEQTLPSFRPYLALPPVLDLADARLSDRAVEWNVSRFSWEHQLLGFHPDRPVRELLRLRLIQDVRMDAPSHGDEWEATYLQANWQPFPFLQLDWNQKIRTEDGETEANLVGLTVSNSDLWSASLLAEYLQGTIEQYRLSGRYRLSERLGLSGYWLYDARQSSWTEQRYGLSRRFGDLWQFETYIALTDENQREDAFSIGLRISLLSF